MDKKIKEFINELGKVKSKFNTVQKPNSREEITILEDDFFQHDFFTNALEPFQNSTYAWSEDFIYAMLDTVKEWQDTEELGDVIDYFKNWEYYQLSEDTVDIYNGELIEWLGESNYNMEYLNRAIERGAKTGFDLLQSAQRFALDEHFEKLKANLIEWLEDLENEEAEPEPEKAKQ